MDLNKVSDNDKLDLCKFYFKIGFFCLPFVWLVNVAWFFHDAFQRSTFAEQKSLRFYVLFSLFGGSIWVIAMIAWIYTYQTQRYFWGVDGELLSYTLPTGEF